MKTRRARVPLDEPLYVAYHDREWGGSRSRRSGTAGRRLNRRLERMASMNKKSPDFSFDNGFERGEFPDDSARRIDSTVDARKREKRQLYNRYRLLLHSRIQNDSACYIKSLKMMLFMITFRHN